MKLICKVSLDDLPSKEYSELNFMERLEKFISLVETEESDNAKQLAELCDKIKKIYFSQKNSGNYELDLLKKISRYSSEARELCPDNSRDACELIDSIGILSDRIRDSYLESTKDFLAEELAMFELLIIYTSERPSLTQSSRNSSTSSISDLSVEGSDSPVSQGKKFLAESLADYGVFVYKKNLKEQKGPTPRRQMYDI